TFGNSWIGIQSPYEKDVAAGVRSDKDLINIQKAQFEDFPEIVSILDRSWVLGGRGQMIFLLAQEKAVQPDSLCTIYAIDDDGGIYDFGQSFFEFVRDSCLGKRIVNEFPRLLNFMLPEDTTADQVILNTFTPGG
ncbi:MAG: hypothetical protein AAFN65_10805, partial [Bacteroidota bacterium]